MNTINKLKMTDDEVLDKYYDIANMVPMNTPANEKYPNRVYYREIIYYPDPLVTIVSMNSEVSINIIDRLLYALCGYQHKLIKIESKENAEKEFASLQENHIMQKQTIRSIPSTTVIQCDAVKHWFYLNKLKTVIECDDVKHWFYLNKLDAGDDDGDDTWSLISEAPTEMMYTGMLAPAARAAMTAAWGEAAVKIP